MIERSTGRVVQECASCCGASLSGDPEANPMPSPPARWVWVGLYRVAERRFAALA